MCYSFYVGALKAMWCGFTSIVPSLMGNARNIAAGLSQGFPVHPAMMALQQAEYAFQTGSDPAEVRRGLQLEIVANQVVSVGERDHARP